MVGWGFWGGSGYNRPTLHMREVGEKIHSWNFKKKVAEKYQISKKERKLVWKTNKTKTGDLVFKSLDDRYSRTRKTG